MFMQKMYSMLAIVIATLAVTLSASSLQAKSLTLAENGKAKAVIIVDASVMAANQKVDAAGKVAETQRQTLRAAVNDLSVYLGKLSGGEFKITQINEGQDLPKADGMVSIIVGKPAAKLFGEPKVGKYNQGLRMVAKDNQVGLIGQSDESTSYAIYELLGQLGCRWYMPGELGEYVPVTKTIKLDEMDKSIEPYTYSRTLWYADADYKRRNRCGGFILSTGHALEGYVSKEDRVAHPEWRATVDGKPHATRLKWSAPGLADHIANVIIERHRKSPQPSWSLSPDDGMGYDDSDEDKALDAGDFDPAFDGISLTDRLVSLVNPIAAKVSKEFPDVRFGLLAYANYNRPPIREKLHPSIIPQIAPITYRRAHPTNAKDVPGNEDLMYIIKGWYKQAPVMSYYYYGWFLAEPSAPNPFLAKWGNDVPLALSHGGRFWQPETTTNFETTMHALYMSLRLAWDETQKPQDIYDEINTNFYGAAAKQMTAYWEFIDHCWVDTPEYSGAGFAYNGRWTPERMTKARQLMNEALVACANPLEIKRVRLADESLRQFELFMQIRYDFAAGNWRYLGEDAEAWGLNEAALGREYSEQFAFSKVGWSSTGSMGRGYYNYFYKRTYDDAARIAKEGVVLTRKPINEWKFIADKENTGEASGYGNVDFDDSKWKTTDVNTQMWSTIGYHNYFGTMWYRQTVPGVAVAKDKKTFLWVSSTDGSVKVFVNGKHVPYVDDKGETKDIFNGFSAPASFDITEHVEKGKPIHISIEAKRTFFNELGTGGLLSPLVIYREK